MESDRFLANDAFGCGFVDDEKYECTISFNPDRQIFRINQEEYETKVVLMNENLLELLINHELESFCFQEDEKHTKIISGGFAFALRSNLLRNQVLSMRKNELEQKIFQNLILRRFVWEGIEIKYK